VIVWAMWATEKGTRPGVLAHVWGANGCRRCGRCDVRPADRAQGSPCRVRRGRRAPSALSGVFHSVFGMPGLVRDWGRIKGKPKLNVPLYTINAYRFSADTYVYAYTTSVRDNRH